MRLPGWAARAATLLGYAVFGSALAFGYRGDWLIASVPAAAVLLSVAWWVRGELMAVRETLREKPPTGKHHRPPVQAYVCSRCGEPGVTVWSSEEAAARGLRLGLDLVCDRCLTGAVRLAATLGGAGARD